MEHRAAPWLTGAAARVVRRALVLLGVLVPLLGWSAPSWSGSGSDHRLEEQLAERYAPVVHLVAQPEDCGPGEPYLPSAVDPLFGNDTVALRGPWTQQDLIEVGPTAADLSAGLPGYSLDYPGNPLEPGCSYETWAESTFAGSPPTVYARVATEAGFPGLLAIEYWFYYPFNDFNNKHEGDWERIQVELEATDVAAALRTRPTRVVLSAHEGSEYADWGAPKVDVVGRTHPVVRVSAGSHANHFGEALYLGRSGSQGLGCDSTLDATTVAEPTVRTIPSDQADAVREFPWIGYEGAWGEQQARAFYSGPTGPSTKDSWDRPFTWSQEAASRSYAVPGGEVYGVTATDFFCGAVGSGSVLLLRLTDNPLQVLAVLGAAVLVVAWLVRRTAWGSSDPLPATRARSTGQTVADAWEVFRGHPLLFLGIGSSVAVASVATGLVGQLGAGVAGSASAGSSRPVWVAVGIGVLLVMTLLSQAATMAALAELDAGRRIGPLGAYRLALPRARALLGTALLWFLVVGALLLSVFFSPLALVVAVASALFVPVVQFEGLAGPRALRRSAHLVRGQVVKVVLVLLLAAALTSLLGGLLGAVVILAVQAPFVVVNLIPGIVQALLNPFTSLMLGLSFHHGLAREQESGTGSEPVTQDAAP